ncbi:hypothetical protein Q7P37_000450 [Cladosporium fusiforme]
MDDQNSDAQEQVLVVPNNLDSRVQFIEQQRKNVIQMLCQQSKKANGIPDASTEPTKSLLPRLGLFMQWLETHVEISPILKERSKIDMALRLIYAVPQYHFQEQTRERARQLYERWEAQNWGKGEVVEDPSEEDDNSTSDDDVSGGQKKRKTSTTSMTPGRNSNLEIGPTTLHPPPANHPIFGTRGIMHGVVQKVKSRRKDWILVSRYPKRDAKVFGDNGLTVGDWWPMQLLALFHGAHGARMGGIAGNAQTGAYSVVTSGGPYEDLDQDKGDVLFYSGSRSHDNEDPKQPFPSSNATEALKSSQRLGRPVRVLRAAGVAKGKNSLRPTVGIRYDGLYRVVSMALNRNTKGGLYEQFRLERLADQPSLDSIAKSRPNAREISDYYKREDGY